ncbi:MULTISPECIES: CBS domain-containing protein [unclassified Streptomyces]|uniref:CBS domain-containing protein n=1 Tax=unclassified Streptomyces TaxID=2593676 RepID=UPI003D74A43C
MRARELAVGYEAVHMDSGALAAARLMAEHRLPGLLVLDAAGEPKAILPASQMVKVLVPRYVLDDPTLASVVDEHHADRFCEALADRTVGDCLPSSAMPPPMADADDTALEVATLMARARSPLVAVAEHTRTGADGRKHGGGAHLLGVITASHLLHVLLDAAGVAGVPEVTE